MFKALERGGVDAGGEAFVARVKLVRENSWRLIDIANENEIDIIISIREVRFFVLFFLLC